MSKPKFFLTHLYPKEMSIYGDMGNVIAMRYRLNKYGFEVVYQEIGLKDNMPTVTDFYFIGGGQDKDQKLVAESLRMKASKLASDIALGVPTLAICGGYQLLGHRFVTGSGEILKGIGVFPVKTEALNTEVSSRCVGNVVIKTNLGGMKDVKLIGFENHSGQTYFIEKDSNSQILGKVLLGYGNNSKQWHEGCVVENAIGTYLHGSLLPKNPELADYLIQKAFEKMIAENRLDKKYKNLISTSAKSNIHKPSLIDDSLALKTKQKLVNRFLKVDKK